MSLAGKLTLLEYMDENPEHLILNEDWKNNLLDLAGMIPIPGIGTGADTINMFLFAKEKQWVNAGVSALSLLEGIGDIIGKGGKLALKLSSALGIDVAGKIKSTGGFGKKIIDIAQLIQAWLDSADDEGGVIDKVLDKVEKISENWPTEGIAEGEEKPSNAYRASVALNRKWPWLGNLIKSATAGSPFMTGIRKGLEAFIAAIGKLVGQSSSSQDAVTRAKKFMSQSAQTTVPVGAAVQACKTLGGCKNLKEEKRLKNELRYRALLRNKVGDK
tara:strand:- start:482 stop:1300 length:819 start_codon:yes stop_codon:yes gene_type:complete